MKLRLDAAKCMGHAQCYAVDPALFPIDDSGYSIVQTQRADTQDEALALEGVTACPERVLRFDD